MALQERREGTKDAFPCHSWVAETGHCVEAEVGEETEPLKFPRKLLRMWKFHGARNEEQIKPDVCSEGTGLEVLVRPAGLFGGAGEQG